MCPFPIPPLLKNKSQYELDAARRCPFYTEARIRVKLLSIYTLPYLLPIQNLKLLSL